MQNLQQYFALALQLLGAVYVLFTVLASPPMPASVRAIFSALAVDVAAIRAWFAPIVPPATQPSSQPKISPLAVTQDAPKDLSK